MSVEKKCVSLSIVSVDSSCVGAANSEFYSTILMDVHGFEELYPNELFLRLLTFADCGMKESQQMLIPLEPNTINQAPLGKHCRFLDTI